MNPRVKQNQLETRIKEQFPALFITLVSVLIGLVLADLIAEARTRMVLLPITSSTLRTWFELSGNGFSAFAAWIVYAHIGVSRRHIPTFADALIAFALPLCLLFGTSYVGVFPMWPWFYFAGTFLAISLATTLWLLHVMRSEPELVTFRRLLRRDGYLSIFVIGVPFYAMAGWADRHDYLSPLLEIACAASATPAALLAIHLFQRDWRYAVDTASDPE